MTSIILVTLAFYLYDKGMEVPAMICLIASFGSGAKRVLS